MMRSRFAAFLLGSLCLAAGPALAQAPAPAPAPEEEIWEFAPDKAGVELMELFEIINQNTGASIVYNPQDPAIKGKRVYFTGKYRVGRSRIFDWLQAMMSYHKLVLLPLGPSTSQQWAVMNVNDPSIANHPVYVPEGELEKWADRDGVYIVTTLTVRKLTDTTRARNALANLITRPTGRINDVPGTQAFVVGDFAPVVYSMALLVRAMDVENQEFIPVFRVVRLDHAVATEMEPILQDLLSAGVSAQRPRPGQPGLGAPEKPDPVIRADPRQEAIVIYAVQEDVDRIARIIQELDSEVLLRRNSIQIYPCKHTLADELADTLNELIRSTGLGAGTTGGRTPRQPGRPGTPPGGGGSQEETEVVIVADSVANSLLIQANKQQYLDIFDLITQLDIRRPQVLIEAALIELRVNDNLTFGVELASAHIDSTSGDRTEFGVSRFGLSTLTDLDDDGIPDINIPNFGANGLVTGIFNNQQFPLIIQAFKGISKAKALSMPSVVVDDGRQAEITSSQSEPFLTTDTTSAGTDRQNVDYVDAKTTLRISPHISSSNYLKLHLELEVSSFGARPQPNLPPSQQSRILTTDIVVPDRSTLIMGGIIDSRNTETVGKVPILGDLPILGYLFRNTTMESFKTNLFLFITPTILGKQGDRDDEYFQTYHEVSWSRKLLAEQLIDEELEIYNARFRASETSPAAPKPETPEGEMEMLEDAGLLDFPSFHGGSSTSVTREQAKEMFEQERARAVIRPHEVEPARR